MPRRQFAPCIKRASASPNVEWVDTEQNGYSGQWDQIKVQKVPERLYLVLHHDFQVCLGAERAETFPTQDNSSELDLI